MLLTNLLNATSLQNLKKLTLVLQAFASNSTKPNSKVSKKTKLKEKTKEVTKTKDFLLDFGYVETVSSVLLLLKVY